MGTHPIFESDFDCLTEMSLWHIPSSNSEARERPKLTRVKPPPIDYSKLNKANNAAAEKATFKPFKMPKSSFSRPKNRATFSVPLGLLKHESSSDSEESSDDEIKILERDRLEIERIRKKRMNEKGINLYNRRSIDYGQQSSYVEHDPIEEQRQLQEEIEELKRKEEDKREKERQQAKEEETKRKQDDEKRRKLLERNKRNAELKRKKEEDQLQVVKLASVILQNISFFSQ